MRVHQNVSTPLIRASKGHPCPICGKPDWCSFSADGTFVICMRIAEGSIKETINGGYLHRLSNFDLSHIRTISAKAEKPKRDDLPELADYFCEQGKRSPHRIKWLSEQLGLPVWALNDLHIGWSEKRKAFSFPMKNGMGQVIGISLRNWDGGKYSVTCSRLGLFIPKSLEISSQILISEGATDCAALFSLGFPVIGRPSCTGGVIHIIDWIKQNKRDELVIVSDADDPGRHGAHSLACTLCLYIPSVKVIYPPDNYKDARSWINDSASTQDVHEIINTAKQLTLTTTWKNNNGRL